MKIVGIQSLSLLDYSGLPSIVLFTKGCNLSCWYCSNWKSCVDVGEDGVYSMDEVIEKCNSAAPLINAVVICGGEPTIHPDLIDFIKELKRQPKLINKKFKVDTNGTNSKMTKQLTQVVDFISLDIKGVIGSEYYTEEESSRVIQSLDILKTSGIRYEVRTPIHKYMQRGHLLLMKDNFGITSDVPWKLVKIIKTPEMKDSNRFDNHYNNFKDENFLELIKNVFDK
jgi:pyruvate formate lyase activating enzyme